MSRFDTLSPLTCKDDEWNEVGEGTYQNIRKSTVFKNGKDGKPYFIDAHVQKTPDGNCWNGSLNLKDGRKVGVCHIKDFSNMPTITIDVLEKEVEKDNWETWMKDETQLEELAKHYDFEIK